MGGKGTGIERLFGPLRDKDPTFDAMSTSQERFREVVRRLVAYRKSRRPRLSQKKVGWIAGVSQSTMSEFEAGINDPRVSTVSRYAAALGYTIEIKIVPIGEGTPNEFVDACTGTTRVSLDPDMEKVIVVKRSASSARGSSDVVDPTMHFVFRTGSVEPRLPSVAEFLVEKQEGVEA